MLSCSHSEQQRSGWTTATRKPRGGRGCHRRCRRPGGGKPSTKKKIIGRGIKVRVSNRNTGWGGEAGSYVLRSPDHFEIRNGRGQRHKIMKKCDRPTDGQKRVVKSACTRLKKTVLLAIIFTATIRWSLQQSRTGRSLQQRRTRGRSLLPEGLE